MSDDNHENTLYNVTSGSIQGAVIGDNASVHQVFAAKPLPRQLSLHQLPSKVDNFVGRSTEASTVIGEFQDGPAGTSITIFSGMPGVGKSALAIKIAHQLASTYSDVQFYADLNSYGDFANVTSEEVLDRFLRALGALTEVMPVGLEEKAALYRSMLAGKKVLLLLDNAATPDQVRQLLPGASSCAVLVTSRDRLPGLVAFNSARLIVLNPLDAVESKELLARIIGARRIAIDDEASQRLAELCGDLPLALTIAAARLAVRPNMAVASLCERLSAEGKRLSELSLGNIEVRTSFNLSYQNLRSESAQMFKFLSLTPGREFSLSVAAAFIDSNASHAANVLESLVDVHFVDPPDSSDRYGMHDLMREFSRERLVDEETTESREQAAARMLEWYLVATSAAEALLIPARIRPWRNDTKTISKPADRAQALAWLEVERSAILNACQRAYDGGLYDFSWRIADAAWGFYQLRKYWKDWKESHVIGLRAATLSESLQGQAWMLTGLGGVQWELGEYGDAATTLKRALAMHRAQSDTSGESRALVNLGFTYYHSGNYVESIGYSEQALQIASAAQDSYREAWALYSISKSNARLGNYSLAIDICLDALSIFRETRNKMAEGFAMDSLGEAYREIGQLGDSLRALDRACAIRREVGDRYGEAMSLDNLGKTIELEQGREAALPYWVSSLDILRELGAPEADEVRIRLEGPGDSNACTSA